MVDSFDLEATHFQIRSERVIEAHSGSRAFGIRIRAHWQIPGSHRVFLLCREADDSVEAICRQVLDEAAKRAAAILKAELHGSVP